MTKKRTEYGICPKCNGDGVIPANGLSASVHHICHYCNGSKQVVTAYEEFLELPATEKTDSQLIPMVIDTTKYYWCKCEHCGWENSSEFCEGCHPIADTGDHTDPVCPVCGSSDIEGDPTIDIPAYEKEHKFLMPLDLLLDPYKKTVKMLSEKLFDAKFPQSPDSDSQLIEEILKYRGRWLITISFGDNRTRICFTDKGTTDSYWHYSFPDALQWLQSQG